MTPQANTGVAFRNDQTRAVADLGMWVFLASEAMFFGPLILGYLYGRLHYPDAFAAAGRHTEFALGTLNTALLLTGSLLVAMASVACEANRHRLAAGLLYGAAALGAAFLAIKATEYRLEWLHHFVPGAGFALDVAGPDLSQPAQLFFLLYFVTTALHAVHLAIGVVVMLVMAAGLAQAHAGPRQVHVAGLYWHFVDMVWLFLYPMYYLLGRSGS
jgi:cytochrome c oxidase subunit 3